MKTLPVILSICAALWVAMPAFAARCTGSAYCAACKNCSKCAHCSSGGSCGVCSPAKREPATIAPPKPLPVQPVPAARDEVFTPVRNPVAPVKPAEAYAPRELLEPTTVPAVAAPVEVHFSPGPDCAKAVVDLIDGAKTSVKLQAYRLTSLSIAMAIVKAKDRGVAVMVILDGAQQSPKYSDGTYLSNSGVTVMTDRQHPIAHNKVVIVDEATVATGSFNFTEAGSSNAENLVVIRDVDIAKRFADNFESHRVHAEKYKPPATPTP